jgi:clan AA aspartic protease
MLLGFFHNKCPRIKIILVGTSQEEVEVIIDNGFNGYLTLPEAIAERIGLKATGGIGSSTIADGSSSPYISYLGKVIYNDTRIDTEIEVQPHCKILLGTSLLEELGLSLFVDVRTGRVELNPSSRLMRPLP